MASFLLEIGTEELPADFAAQVLAQLEPMVRRDLSEQRLPVRPQLHQHTARIAVCIDGLASSASDLQEERKGPPAGQAFQDGVPTKAAIGFAQRCGLRLSSWKSVRPQGSIRVCFGFGKGRAASDLLAELIPGWIAACKAGVLCAGALASAAFHGRSVAGGPAR